MCEILTVSLDCVDLQNTWSPCSGSGCYGDGWKTDTFFLFNKIRVTFWKTFHTLQSSPPPFFKVSKTNPLSGKLRNQQRRVSRKQLKMPLTVQQGRRDWWTHNLGYMWSGWGPASWPAGRAGSPGPWRGSQWGSCRPTTDVSGSEPLERSRPEPPTTG